MKRILLALSIISIVFSNLQLLAEEESKENLSQCLSVEGMSAGWLKSTQKIRDNLSKLKSSDPKVSKWLPAIKRRSLTLRKLKKIGSMERDIFTRFFEAMLEDLVNDKKVLARFSGQTINYGYWSKHINKLTGTKVQVPANYDSDKEYQFFMYYKIGGGMYWNTPTKKWAGPHDKGAKVSGPHRPKAEFCQKVIPDTFQAWSALYYGVKGRMGLVEELKELTLAMSQDFSMSLDRVFLSGYSDGGYSAMWIASRYPHLVAGIAPGVANWQYGNMGNYTFFNFATLVVDGWRDGGYIGENLARFTTLNNMGYDIKCIISHHGHSMTWLEEVETVKKIMAWAKTKRRNLNRKHIKYATWNLAWNRAYWFTIKQMENPLLASLVDAKIEGNTIQVKAKNISVYQIALNDKLVDMKAPLKIFTNGRLSYEGPCQAKVTVDHLKSSKAKFVKDTVTHGGMSAHAFLLTYFNKKSGHKKFRIKGQSWSWVKFTGGTEVERKIVKASSWVGKDVDVTEKKYAETNLLIYGGPLRNKFVEKFTKDLPIKFEKGKFTVGNKVYDQPQHCVKFIIPNPLNPKKNCVIIAFNDPAAVSKELGIPKLDISPWGFRGGDCQVFGIKKNKAELKKLDSVRKKKRRKGDTYKKDVYIFGSDWKVYDQTPIGTIEKEFGWNDILQLKAEAIKEKTGAQVGLYGSQPGYLKWKTSFNKGAITMNDVAVTHQVPEFIMTCELTGKQLKGFVTPDKRGKVPVPNNTLFANKTDPGYDPKTSLLISEIDDVKIYKVASGYALCDSGALGLSASVESMPKPHFYFETVKEFAEKKGTTVKSNNLKQTEIEVTEAVVSYIKKRGKISPRVK
ncbi:MAG: hypothetical protein COA79_16095 [Planctomycetota bacterium]|nr:MAG: hypothetical protein COA79_16095 [Planctomycetota bacterium]